MIIEIDHKKRGWGPPWKGYTAVFLGARNVWFLDLGGGYTVSMYVDIYS